LKLPFLLHRLSEHEGLSSKELKSIVEEMEQGLHDGDLGSFVFKKRIGIGSQGKRGGLRLIVAHKRGDKAIFMYGYPKNVRDNISPKEKEAFKRLSKDYMGLNDLSLKRLLRINALIEITL